MKARDMGVKMSRVGFIELYKAMEKVVASNGGHDVSLFAARDFVERNAEKYAKVGSIVDETVQFPVLSAVEFRENEQGFRTDNNIYIVIRAKKLPNGKREYWLWRANRSLPRQGAKIQPDRKVSASALKLTSNQAVGANYFANHKLPKAN